MNPGGPAVCEGDEEVTEDPQPDPDPQPTPTYDSDTGEFATDFDGNDDEPGEFPILPVAGAAGALILIAVLA